MRMKSRYTGNQKKFRPLKLRADPDKGSDGYVQRAECDPGVVLRRSLFGGYRHCHYYRMEDEIGGVTVAEWKRKHPKLSARREIMAAAPMLSEERAIRNAELTDESMHAWSGHAITVDDMVVTDCSFADMDLAGAAFLDTVFERCDFSNIQAAHLDLRRCEFRNCKLVGADLTQSALMDVLFSQCDMRYSTFSFGRLDRAEFTEVQLSESDFFECVLKPVRFARTQLENVNFRETELSGLDLSDCTFEQLEVTPSKIGGCTVSKEQAVGFARMFGLLISRES